MSRRKKEKTLKETISVFCEGYTEKIYFDILKRKYRAANIKIKAEVTKGQSSSLVNNAIRSLEKTSKKNKPDRVIVVFDKDDNQNDDIQKAFKMAREHNFGIAFSNECFDLWILLHFTEISGFLSRDSLNQELEKNFSVEKYSKIKNDETKLSQHLEHNIVKACKNSQNVENDLSKFSVNPFTNVGLIVEDIFEIKR